MVRTIGSYHHCVVEKDFTLREQLAVCVARRHQLSEISQTYLRAWILTLIREIRAAEWPDLDQRPGHYYVSVHDAGKYQLLSGPYPSHRIAKMWQPAVAEVVKKHDYRAAFYAFGTARLRDGVEPCQPVLQKWGYSLEMEAADES